MQTNFVIALSQLRVFLQLSTRVDNSAVSIPFLDIYHEEGLIFRLNFYWLSTAYLLVTSGKYWAPYDFLEVIPNCLISIIKCEPTEGQRNKNHSVQLFTLIVRVSLFLNSYWSIAPWSKTFIVIKTIIVLVVDTINSESF